MDSNKKHFPDDPQNQGQEKASIRILKLPVNNPSYFNDDYESQQEDELTEEEPKTEKEQQEGKRGRALIVNKTCAINIA